MFGKKSKRIIELEKINNNLVGLVDRKNNQIVKLEEANNTAYRALETRATEQIAVLQYRCDLLESLLKQVRINVTLPARRG